MGSGLSVAAVGWEGWAWDAAQMLYFGGTPLGPWAGRGRARVRGWPVDQPTPASYAGPPVEARSGLELSGLVAGSSESLGETPSEAGEAPAHLAFDEPSPVLVFHLPMASGIAASVGFHNNSGSRLKLNLQWSKRYESGKPSWVSFVRQNIAEKLTGALGRTELEPGEATEVTVTSDFVWPVGWPLGAFEHRHTEMFLEPLVVEVHSVAADGERRQAEVELLFVQPVQVRVDTSLLNLYFPLSPRPVLSLVLSADWPTWVRLDEPLLGHLRVLVPERHFLLERDFPLTLPLRVARVLALEDLEVRQDPNKASPALTYATELGRCVWADEGDVEAVGAARGREERQRLVRELATAALQRPTRLEEPQQTLRVSVRVWDSPALELTPSFGLDLPLPPKRAYVHLASCGAGPLVWAVRWEGRGECPLELDETEGVLNFLSRGHLGLSLRHWPASGERQVELSFRFAFAPSPEHDPPLPDSLSDYLDLEEQSHGHVHRQLLPLFLPPPPTDSPSANPLTPDLTQQLSQEHTDLTSQPSHSA